MLQIPEKMRRQIALSPQMPQGLALLWELPERRLEAQADDLRARGARNKAVLAFQELAPPRAGRSISSPMNYFFALHHSVLLYQTAGRRCFLFCW